MNDFIMKLGCHFTEEEKEQCVETIYTMLDLANEARRSGILVLEEEALHEKENMFLKHGLSLIVNGTDPAIVEDVLENMILADGHTGSELLKRLIMLKGMRAIQAGDNPQNMAYRLSAMLGERYISRICDVYEEKKETDLQIIHNFLDSWKGRKVLAECKEFESIMLDVHFGFSQILRFVDYKTVLIAVNGCSEELISRLLLDYTSRRRSICYIEDQTAWGNLPLSSILRAQEEVLEVYRKLEDRGEIRSMKKVMNEIKQFQETGQVPQSSEGQTVAFLSYEKSE